MPARSRTISEVTISGLARFNWEGAYNPSATTSVPTGSSTCVDNPGHGGDCEPFTLNRMTTKGGKLNRSFGGTSTDNWFSDYLCQFFRQTANVQHLAVSGVPSEAWRCTNAVARTNPSRPVVDVPVNLLDLKRGIQNLRDAGNSVRDIIRRSGGRYLEYEFMIKPLVGDIVKLANLAGPINSRINEINRLFGGRGLRRTVGHGTWSSQAYDPSLLVQSTYDTVNVKMRTQTTVSCRTHVRWGPQQACGLRPPPDQIRRWAVRAVQGLTVDLSTLWEITPWSWLADWYGNVGEYLVANRNIIPARLIGVYPMKHTRTSGSFPFTSVTVRGRPTTISAGERIREQKLRSIGAVALSAYFPFLSNRQVGILAAVAAARA